MKKLSAQSLILTGAVLFSLILAGCGGNSAPARFYTLDPVKRTGPEGPLAPAAKTVAISITHIEIPDYLDRPEIVTRTLGNDLQVSEFDRWGGDLRSDVARVLAETISTRLPGNRVLISTARRVFPCEYRISVSVSRFDAVPGEKVWLKAQWAVMGGDGRTVLAHSESDLTEGIQGQDFRSIVAAMSRAANRLGIQIADALKPVLTDAVASGRGDGKDLQPNR